MIYKAIAKSKLFDGEWYIKEYPDVHLSGMDPVDHYIKYGWRMNRNPSEKFSTQAYFELNPDVYQAYVNPLQHYIFQGLREGRNFKRFLKIEELGSIEYSAIPVADFSYIPEKAVRTICFYLPQFHAIPENDQWWGKGFTEWTNVAPAKPQFKDHYQPHVPHQDVGHYNLLDPETFKRQINQAQAYGIDGFCFYFYWFGGHRLLEKPIDLFFKDKSHSMSYCLCWANENWSRRWDGNDLDILIAQNHSDEDDLNFIQYIAKYITDERYIRVDGRPLISVYRPAELPDARRTLDIWRNWCRNAGIGEVYIAMTNSFEKLDPHDLGFDAVIDFQPNAAGLAPSRDLIEDLPGEFEGGLFNYENLVLQSENYEQKEYPVFRGACPSWDNTARKKNRGYIFLNSSPLLYQKWLDNSIRYSIDQGTSIDNRLIFINAWNEWAEGAHLEPDERYGYAWLEATKMATLRASLKRMAPIEKNTRKLAIVIHAFYLDVLEEFLEKIQENAGNLDIRIYVSVTNATDEKTAKNLLENSGFSYSLHLLKNHGRDVLPFITLAKQVVQDDYPLILKLHTKKSRHRDDGDSWRNELLDKLVSGGNLIRNFRYLLQNPSVGILAPEGHLVPLKNHWGSNAEHCARLAARLGFSFEEIVDLDFPAGTMFFTQTRAMLPLLNLALPSEEFDEELGQTDGTLMHAIERILTVSSLAAGLQVVEQHGNIKKSEYKYADIG